MPRHLLLWPGPPNRPGQGLCGVPKPASAGFDVPSLSTLIRGNGFGVLSTSFRHRLGPSLELGAGVVYGASVARSIPAPARPRLPGLPPVARALTAPDAPR